MVSSNLTSQPDWLETFTEGVTVAYGFDEDGMWFSGDAGAPYPVRTNYDITETDVTTLIFTFIHSSNCSDQGVCFFNKDNEPYWNWGEEASRIALNFNCGTPELAGQNATADSEYELTVGNTYTCKLVYDPSEAGLITAYLYEGTSAAGEPVDTLSLQEKLPAGEYRIGFSADQDNEELRSYFTYAQIGESAPLITRVFRAVHLPRRRHEAENAEDGAPVNVQPGQLVYDYEQNKLYAGLDDESTVMIGGGLNGNPFDQDLNTTDNVTFGSVALSNGTQLTVGSFDNMTGGQNGIGLHCYIGYELNWQGGHLRSVMIGDTSGTAQTIIVDSALEFPGAGTANVTINAVGLTFSDGTQQTTAGVPSNPAGITGATAITNIVKISQSDYNALATKDPTTLYIIT